MDLEFIAVCISFSLFAFGSVFHRNSKYVNLYNIGSVAGLIDLLFYFLSNYTTLVTQFVASIDFSIYYISYSLIFFQLWNNSTKTPSENILYLSIFFISLTIMLSFLYMITQNQLFLESSLISFSINAFLLSFKSTLNQMSHLGYNNVFLFIGGVFLILSTFLYPSFIINPTLFFISLFLFYIGWIIVLTHINLINFI